jgi:hypothetical protein
MSVSFSTQVVFWSGFPWDALDQIIYAWSCTGKFPMNQLGTLNDSQNVSLFEHRKIPADLQCQPRHLQIFHQVKSLERSYLWAQKGNSAEAIFTTGL